METCGTQKVRQKRVDRAPQNLPNAMNIAFPDIPSGCRKLGIRG